jgi:RNA polymerase sigma-70 factor (ECF subfamily)
MSGDDALVVRARAGDPGAWGELYRAHAGRLLVWLRHLAPADAVAGAEDLAADAWLTAAEKIAGFAGSDDEFVGWLFGIARNHAANARRRSLRRATDPKDDLDDTLVLPAHEDRLAGKDWVRRALQGLPVREREVVACTEVIGLDVASTSAALGISAVAVRVARHRGLSRLRKAPYDGEGRATASA